MLHERIGKPRPRLSYTDCMLMVFRYITGADVAVTLCRFAPFLKEGQEGMSLKGLTACLKAEGYTLVPCEEAAVIARRSDGAIDKDALAQFGQAFDGQVVMLYGRDGQMQHAVLVCSGGIVFDPSPDSPEDGEFIADHFDRIALIGDISMAMFRVTRS